MRKVLGAITTVVILLFTSPQVTNHSESGAADRSINFTTSCGNQENETNVSLKNITDGSGITAVVKNCGRVDLVDIEVFVNISNGLFVFLKTTHVDIPLLVRNASTKIHIRLFGVRLGKLMPLPEISVVVQTNDHAEKKVRIITRVFGPFTKIIGIIFDSDVFNGYTLFSPEYSTKTFVIDNNGTIVHTWESPYIQGLGVYLLENGNLLRTTLSSENPVFIAGGATGGVERYDWNGTLLWEFSYSTDQVCLHHDIEVLPNGHVLMVAWEYKSAADAITAGRDPDSLPIGQIWPDHVIEVEPTGISGGTIVWEWHIWDHLIQEFDQTKENYGVVVDHPELLDINFGIDEGRFRADWNHINSIDYNSEFDQILLSARHQDELWVIDHSTTTAEAAGHTGGRYGKGGDILYRWGNPRTYQAGTSSDQKLFGQHDARWIPAGIPGEGNILVFNNGQGRPEGQYSSVEELTPPVNMNGTYWREPGSAFGPQEPTWRYTAVNPSDFFAGYLSGAQRLANGNTRICDGAHGVFFEVTPVGKTIWGYLNTMPSGLHNQVFSLQCYPPEYPGLKFLFSQ